MDEQQAKWDARHLRLARFWAEECSKDPTTKVGAVVVGLDRRNVAMGYNGFPPGVKDTPERWNDRPTKYAFTQHAERNVLDNAHFDLKGATLATTMFPCVECAKSMVSKGIARLVSSPAPPRLLVDGVYVPSWRDTVPHALTILREGGVELVLLEDAPVVDEREAFKKAHSYLDLSEETGPWSELRFVHPMIQALWDGWKRRAEK